MLIEGSLPWPLYVEDGGLWRHIIGQALTRRTLGCMHWQLRTRGATARNARGMHTRANAAKRQGVAVSHQSSVEYPKGGCTLCACGGVRCRVCARECAWG